MSIYELGTDIRSDWSFNNLNGDLELTSNEDNIVQSIVNRLNTRLGFLELYYSNYGSELYSFMGELIDETLLKFVKIEVESTLKQDPRLQDATVEISYTGDGKIKLEIDNTYNEDSDLSLSLVLNETGEVTVDGSE
ncbi:hypothetical protein [Methanobrevibacter sp.]|uniref:hypothetical protein n=1 Tax=Methanobrevibacter sp. TaxID=66852 RepID=UPI00388F40D4